MEKFSQERQDEMEKVMNQIIVQTANKEISEISKWTKKYYRHQGDILREIRQVVKNYFALVDSIDILIESKGEKEKLNATIIDSVETARKASAGRKSKKV